MGAGNWGNTKGVGGGIFERKVDFGPGYPVYFGKDGESLVVLLGGSTKQRQQQAIEAARERWTDYRTRKVLERSDMALTREFKDTIAARVQRDPRFREALFTEAMNAYLGGDTSLGKSILRDLVNATIGFEELAHVLKKSSKSLHRMLAPHGNPNTENFFCIVNALQKRAGIKLQIKARAV